jgi:hypothetical protein
VMKVRGERASKQRTKCRGQSVEDKVVGEQDKNVLLTSRTRIYLKDDDVMIQKPLSSVVGGGDRRLAGVQSSRCHRNERICMEQKSTAEKGKQSRLFGRSIRICRSGRAFVGV